MMETMTSRYDGPNVSDLAERLWGSEWPDCGCEHSEIMDELINAQRHVINEALAPELYYEPLTRELIYPVGLEPLAWEKIIDEDAVMLHPVWDKIWDYHTQGHPGGEGVEL